MSDNNQPILEISDLQQSYPDPSGSRIEILNVPEFSISAGQQVVLVGPSGGGKTTLLHIIAGLLKPDGGSVKIDGIEMSKFHEAGRDRVRANKIGYVFQTFNLLPAFSALENVRLGMSFAKGQHDVGRAKELLNQVGLSDRLHYKPNALSVGQQQRVAVARALANRPKLLLADEPTANVDAKNQQLIVDLIRDVCQSQSVALLLVTHARETADQFENVIELDSINRLLQRSN